MLREFRSLFCVFSEARGCNNDSFCRLVLLNNTVQPLNNANAHGVLRKVTFALNQVQTAAAQIITLHCNYVDTAVTRLWR